MIINHNMNAMNAHRNMMGNTSASGKSMEKLSSGLRINRAGDDAAGLAISEKMRGQIRGLDQASRNSQDGISMIQTGEGGLNETHSILQRMRELAVQAGNDTNTSVDRGEIQKEMNQLTSEINRIGNTTEFNTQKLLNGEKAAKYATKSVDLTTLSTGSVVVSGIAVIDSGAAASNTLAGIASAINGNAALSANYTATVEGNNLVLSTNDITTGATPTVAFASGATVGASSVTSAVDGRATLQIGANADQTFTVELKDMRSIKLGLASTTAGAAGFASGTTNQLTDKSGASNEYALDVSTAKAATAAITTINTAIQSVSSERSKLGAYQNRLEHTIANLNTSSENLTAAESRVRDVDMAKEMMNFSKNNILSQASQAMLAQAKSQPEAVLQLLR